jgi:uncharacterized protein (DUF2249 family)
MKELNLHYDMDDFDSGLYNLESSEIGMLPWDYFHHGDALWRIGIKLISL